MQDFTWKITEGGSKMVARVALMSQGGFLSHGA
jgi:hypothetical protein